MNPGEPDANPSADLSQKVAEAIPEAASLAGSLERPPQGARPGMQIQIGRRGNHVAVVFEYPIKELVMPKQAARRLAEAIRTESHKK